MTDLTSFRRPCQDGNDKNLCHPGITDDRSIPQRFQWLLRPSWDDPQNCREFNLKR